MLAPWVVDEVKTAKLNDKRLNERLAEVLSQLAARPTASIPAACGGRAEMVAAYRFCENEKTSFEAVLQPHRRRHAAADGGSAGRDPRRRTRRKSTSRGRNSKWRARVPWMAIRGAGRCCTCCTPSRRTARRWEPSMPRRGSVKRNRSVLACRVPSGPPFPSKRRRAIVGSSRSSRRVKKLSVAPRRSSFAWPTARPTSMKCWSRERGSHGNVDWIVRACQNRALLCENGENTGEKLRPRIRLGTARVVRKNDPRPWAKSQSRLRNPWATPTASVARSRSCRAGGPRDAASALATGPQTAAGHRERGVGQRGESAAWRRARRMAAADELADRHRGAGAADHPILLCAVDDRNFLSRVEIGLPG